MVEIIKENVDIPVDNGKILLKGSIYYHNETPKRTPWIINLSGITEHRDSSFVKYYTEKFVQAHYYVLSYDYRAHGETANQTGSNLVKYMDKIFEDIQTVIKWINIKQSDRIFNNQIILFGRSLGGAIILTQGFIDEGAKILIPLCTRYDYATYKGLKFPEEVIKLISPRYFINKSASNNERILIAHCKDDKQIPFDNVIQIKDHLGLSDQNMLIFNDGGHSFKGHREEIFDKVLKFLENCIIKSEDIEIPIDSGEISLKGTIYYSKKTPQKAPWIIVATGLMGDRTSYFPNFFIEQFAKAGFYVLCYDHRAHGETAKETGKNWIKLLPKIFEDIHVVIGWVMKIQAERLEDDKIFLFGRSFSGAMLLTQGYIDERAKKICALCTRYDYRTIKVKFPENCIDFMSCKNYLKQNASNNERILLGHCKDDTEIDFFNVLKIKEHLDLTDENVMIFENGNHSFSNHRKEVAERVIDFFKKL